MKGATLSVWRNGSEGLRYLLQLSEVIAVAPVLHSLTSEQRGKMAESLGEFAECLVGSAADEWLRELGQILFQQIFPEVIRVQLRELDEPLTVLTEDLSLPWEVLHDGNDFLSLRIPFARKLVRRERIGRYLGLPRRARPQEEGFAALVIADPTGDLAGARLEGEALHQYFSQQGTCDVLFGAEAQDRNVQRLLISRSYSVIHYCGHVDYDRRLETSSLRLHDRALSADEILPVFRGCPVVFLNACYSDLHLEVHEATPSNDGLVRTESLAEAFMCGNERGVAPAVVGAMWKIPDEPQEAGQEFALAFYHNLLAGWAVGEALQASRRMARDRQWGPTVWGPYVLYGDPLLKPFSHGDRDREAKRLMREGDRRRAEAEPDSEPAAPFDTVARRIVHEALREAKRMAQSGLGTMHLLIGVCDARLPVVERAFEEKGIAREVVCDEARSRARTLIAPGDSDFGISPNVFATFQHAMERATALGRDEVTGEDLLAGLLQCEDGTGREILDRHGLSAELLLGGLARVSFGPLGQEDCTPEAWQVLMDAMRTAQDAGGSLVGTPHLFAGLLQDDQGPLAQGLRRLGVEPAALHQPLGVRGGTEALRDARGIFEVSDSVRDILLRARANSHLDQRDKITPADLLAAFVAHGGGQTGELLRRHGLMLEALSSSLFGTDGGLDMTRFDEGAQKVLARALQCARLKGHSAVGRIHLLYGLLLVPNGDLPRRLQAQQHDAEHLADLLFARMVEGPTPNPGLQPAAGHLGRELILTLCAAEAEAKSEDRPRIGEWQLARACLRSGGEAVEVLIEHGVRWSRLL